MPNERHRPGSFPIIKLSSLAHQLMTTLVDAAILTERAIGEQQMAHAYTALNRSRSQMARYFALLEKHARNSGAQNINPEVTVRHD